MRTKSILSASFLMLSAAMTYGQAVRSGDAYSVFPDRITQRNFVATALSEKEITSNYQSPANQYVSPQIIFKFSINGKDNEMLSGVDHHFNCVNQNGECTTPLIEFGKQLNDENQLPDGTFLQPDTRFNIRLDMRHVFDQFKTNGFYTTFNGIKIFKEDFKGVYVAGNQRPLTWDFDNLHNYKNLELHDPDGDHIYEVSLILNARQNKKITDSHWKLSTDLSPYPQYKSDFVLMDALYNLSLEEMVRAIEKDSTLRTGKEWAGVWTRDVSYSIILSMAILQPKVAQYSLLRKVKDGMVIQDTGTGGAYPVSTDRMIWAVAAWEVYKVTGEKKWLETVYPVIKKSLEADLLNAIDPATGLVKGESSFLDWREQTYPLWMEPADIFESQCLGTNAAHYQAHRVLAMMARELKKDVKVIEKHDSVAAKIKQAINDYLWISEKGYYGQFRYGRTYKILSGKSEALGEALCVLFDIASPEQQKRIIESTPVSEFGIPCIYPHIPNIPPYHNNGIWPFVQSYWTMACAKGANENAVMESLSAIYRPGALFLTNKENFVAENGDFAGTQINSDNMLWSLSGNISMVYKVLFGMRYNTQGLAFEPFVPSAISGLRTLKNYRYRNAVLDIELKGHGNKIKSITMDGKPLKGEVLSSTQGSHKVVIELANNTLGGKFNMVPFDYAPNTPVGTLKGKKLLWAKVNDAASYRVIRNGKPVQLVQGMEYAVADQDFAEYQVIAVDDKGIESFASEPVSFVPETSQTILEMEKFFEKATLNYNGFSGSGFVATSLKENTTLTIPVSVEEEGMYAIDFRYANGNGPVNTENKCALRTLRVDSLYVGTVVFPQRGSGEWSDWGYTNSLIARLKKGLNKIAVSYEPHNQNMNDSVNEAMIDFVRITLLRDSIKK